MFTATTVKRRSLSSRCSFSMVAGISSAVYGEAVVQK